MPDIATTTPDRARLRGGVGLKRKFTEAGVHPFDAVGVGDSAMAVIATRQTPRSSSAASSSR
jgi:hypothetical protein